MTRLVEIPTAFEPPTDARPSAVVARIRAIRPSRRAVLRGLVIGAAATALVPIDWYLTRRESAAAPAGGGDNRSEHLTCTPANYAEEANNWPASGPAVCYGGWKRGTYPCADGYHREGTHAADGATYESTRLTTNCHGRNAWRWNGYRCSDAMSRATFADGSQYSGVTIAACEVGGAEAAPPPSPPPAPAQGSGSTGNPGRAGGNPGNSGGGSPGDSSGGGSRGSGSSGGGEERDPSRPRRFLPSLGLTLRSLPGVGFLFGA